MFKQLICLLVQINLLAFFRTLLRFGRFVIAGLFVSSISWCAMIYDTYSNLIYLAIDTFSHIRSCPSIIARDLDHFVLRTKKSSQSAATLIKWQLKIFVSSLIQIESSLLELNGKLNWNPHIYRTLYLNRERLSWQFERCLIQI